MNEIYEVNVYIQKDNRRKKIPCGYFADKQKAKEYVEGKFNGENYVYDIKPIDYQNSTFSKKKNIVEHMNY